MCVCVCVCVCVFDFSSRLDQPQHMFFALEYRVERRLEINESRRLDRVSMTDEMLHSDGLYVVHDEASSTSPPAVLPNLLEMPWNIFIN